jgi:hypothetical protein
MCYSQLLAAVCAIGAAAATADIAPVEIPLKEIWALNIPGTRNVRELDPPRLRDPLTEEEFIQTSLVEQIARSLNVTHWPKEGEDGGPAFVVVGEDLDALRQAQKVLAGELERNETVPGDKELTLVFYSYYGRTVRLDAVERKNNEVVVKYHLHAHQSGVSTPHFALIPIGKLPPGQVAVTLERLPDTGPSIIVERLRKRPAERFLCVSSTFEVVNR